MNNKTTFVLSKELIDKILEWSVKDSATCSYEQLVWRIQKDIDDYLNYNCSELAELRRAVNNLEDDLYEAIHKHR